MRTWLFLNRFITMTVIVQVAGGVARMVVMLAGFFFRHSVPPVSAGPQRFRCKEVPVVSDGFDGVDAACGHVRYSSHLTTTIKLRVAEKSGCLVSFASVTR